MTVGKGLKVNLFASEKEFPELANPVQMAFDTKGRLWVAVWPTYPHWKPKEPMNDKLLILEDTDGDGKADKCTVFADDLHSPTGFEFCNGGVLVAQAPDLMFLKDTDGDDKADVRERVLHGLDSADTHHTANSFALDPGGALYFQEGTFHHTQVETPYGPPRALRQRRRLPLRAADAEVRRLRHLSASPTRTATSSTAGARTSSSTAPARNPYSRRARSPATSTYPQQARRGRRRSTSSGPGPAPASEILSSRHFPAGDPGQPAGRQRHRLPGHPAATRSSDDGSSFAGDEVEPIVSSTDPNFRPVRPQDRPGRRASTSSTGTTRSSATCSTTSATPAATATHGRVYRVTYEGRPLLKPAKIAGEPIEKLLDLLKEPEDRVRYRARIELGGRDTDEVIAALGKWVAGLDKDDPDYEHHVLEALWVHQYHNVVNDELLKRVLGSPDFRARAAATRVLCYWRDRVPDALDLLKTLAADPHPRVRLEAVRAASFFTVPEAVEVAADLGRAPVRPLPRLRPRRDAEGARALLEEGARRQASTIKFTQRRRRPASSCKTVGTDDLLKMKRTRGVCLELLLPHGRPRRGPPRGRWPAWRSWRTRAELDGAARRHPEPATASRRPGRERRLRPGPPAHRPHRRPSWPACAATWSSWRRARTCRSLRQLGFVALIAADGSVGPGLGRSRPSRCRRCATCLGAMPLIRDPSLRAGLYPEGRAAAARPAASRWRPAASGKGTIGRYVRIELPGRRTLTLAEVEVFSDGRNVARQGKASQKNTANGGDAGRAIDGNTSGSYGDGGQTHSAEETRQPVVGGRSRRRASRSTRSSSTTAPTATSASGSTASRSRCSTPTATSSSRRTKQPAPGAEGQFALGGRSPEGVIRRAAMLALTSVRGQEAADVQGARRLRPRRTPTAPPPCRALQRIPAAHWPQDDAPAAAREPASAYVRDAAGPATGPRRPPLDAPAARRRAGGAAARGRGQGRPQGAGRARRPRHPHRHACPTRCSSTRNASSSRPASRSRFVFENTDMMPHNFVVTQPGALEEIGILAEATATQPGALERHYVPPSDKVLLRQPAAPAARVAAAELHRARRSRASTRTSAPTPATGGGCTARCTSSRTSTSTWPTPRPTWPRTRCRSRTSC